MIISYTPKCTIMKLRTTSGFPHGITPVNPVLRFFLAALLFFPAGIKSFAAGRPQEDQQVTLISNMYAVLSGTERLADGNMVIFDNQYSNGVDGFDIRKFSNFGENFGLRRNGVLLALEKRALPGAADTIFYDINNLNTITYRLEIVGANLAQPDRMAVLQDLFLNREIPISLTDTNNYQFSVSSNTGSSARNRFRIVFYQLSGSPLPVRFSMFNAFHSGEQTRLSWQIQHLEDLEAFEVEKSLDGRTFNVVSGKILPQFGSTNIYEWPDPVKANSTVFYRIKCISTTGVLVYSTVVTVNRPGENMRSIRVVNPVKSSALAVQLVNQPRGNYAYRLITMQGHVLGSGLLRNEGGSSSFQFPTVMPGNVLLHLTAPDGQVSVMRILVVE